MADMARHKTPATAPYIAAYLLAIVAANLTGAAFGKPATVINALLFIGLDLTTRDKLHDLWAKRRFLKMGALIAAGSALSYLVNRNAGPIALASLAAFAAAGTVDTLVYQALHRRPRLARINISNTAAAAVDSLIFPTLAFASLDPLLTIAQFAAKTGGGYLWALLLWGRLRQ